MKYFWIFLTAVSITVNVVLIVVLEKNSSELEKIRNFNDYKGRMIGDRYFDEALEMRSHFEDPDNNNAWYYKPISPTKEYSGLTLLVRDSSGIKVISHYDIENFNSWEKSQNAR